MAEFTQEHKEEFEQKKYFEEGVHKVKILSVKLGRTNGVTEESMKEYMEFEVEGEEGQEDSARLWFTTDKAINYSFNIVRGIFVHNAPKANKERARELVDQIPNTQKLEELCQTLVGKECWFSVYKNMSRPYTNKDGETKYSYDRNITGYEPKPREISTEPIEEVQIENNKPTGEGKSGDEPFAEGF